jgi:hypothetical protein
MKLFLDVQSIKQVSARVGIERYSMELAKAIARGAGEHELWVGTTARAFDAVERILGKWVSRDRIV